MYAYTYTYTFTYTYTQPMSLSRVAGMRTFAAQKCGICMFMITAGMCRICVPKLDAPICVYMTVLCQCMCVLYAHAGRSCICKHLSTETNVYVRTYLCKSMKCCLLAYQNVYSFCFEYMHIVIDVCAYRNVY